MGSRLHAAAPHLRIYNISAMLTSPPPWVVGYVETPGLGQRRNRELVAHFGPRVGVNGTLTFLLRVFADRAHYQS